VVLAEAGYDVVTATDAIDGLRKVYEVRPDLIIAGRELPMINGEDACLKIRQASYLPILVLGSEEEAVETLELGIDAFLTKPPSTNELVARVRALLRRKMGPHPPAAKELAA
jgi:DNA-binding response OmpR family regulator